MMNYLNDMGGLSGRDLNQMVCDDLLLDSQQSQSAIRDKSVREILSKYRNEMKRKNLIGFNTIENIWYVARKNKPRDLTEKEEKFLAYKGLEAGWRRIDSKMDAIKWLYSNLTWLEFEGFCVSILTAHCGVSVSMTQKRESGADGGFDGEGEITLDGKKEFVAVQARQYASHNYVGEDHLANFVGVLNIRGWNHGFIITTSIFSDRAIASTNILKQRNIWIELIDGNRLADIMLEKADSKHGYGLYQTDIGLFYINENILKSAAQRGLKTA